VLSATHDLFKNYKFHVFRLFDLSGVKCKSNWYHFNTEWFALHFEWKKRLAVLSYYKTYNKLLSLPWLEFWVAILWDFTMTVLAGFLEVTQASNLIFSYCTCKSITLNLLNLCNWLHLSFSEFFWSSASPFKFSGISMSN
jgi:hypothetical protein